MTLLQLRLFSPAFIPLKEYVMLFQQAEPAIHKLYDNQFKLTREFLANFIKPEVLLKYNTPSKLQDLDCSNPEFHLRKDFIFIGSKGKKIRSKSRKSDAIVESFLKQALDADVKCGNYLLKKIPINNPFLQCLSSIDPLAIISHSEAALGLLLKLSSHVTPVILKSENDISEYEKECRRIIIDLNLPAFDEEKNKAEIWWYQLKERYPKICKVSLALLLIFHGLRVESSFSMMGNILDKHSRGMKHLLSNTQTVKYNVLDNPAGKNVFKFISSFKRGDKLHTLCYNMRNARGRYKARLKDIAKENKEKKSSLGTVKQNQFIKKDLKKKNVHRNKLAKFDLTLRNSVTNSSKVTIAAKASNSTSVANTSNSTRIANSSNSAIPTSASSTVSSIVSQGETS